MIIIHFYHNGFEVSGHAHSAKYGHDLVCAGVSAIIMGALNWFNSHKITIKNNYIKLVDKDDDIKHLLELLKKQLFALISDDTKQYITIIEHKNLIF